MTVLPNRHPAAGWLIALAIGFGLALSQLLGRTAPPTARDVELEWLDLPRPVAAFTLASDDGEVSDGMLQGKWHLLALGFTHCPDLCPTTLTQLAELRVALTADRVRVLFVSVDPKRDSPAYLAAYVRFFGADFTGVTGDEDALHHLANSLGMEFRHDGPGDQPRISHSPTIAVIGPDGMLRGLLRPGFDIQQAARELTARMRSPS